MTSPEMDAQAAKVNLSRPNPFAAIIHELRTPINHIIGYSEMSQEEAEAQGLEDFLSDFKKIQAAGQQLLQLVNEALHSDETLPDETNMAKLRREIRIPLNTVIGYSEILQKEAEYSGQKGFIPDLEKISSAAKSLLAVVNDSFVFSRVDAGGVAPEPEATRTDEADQDLAGPEFSPGEPDASAKPPEPGFFLIVDHNPLNRDLLARRLQREGHTVATAENGRQALDMLKKNDFDLVLMDIMMPEMDGFQVLAQLKSDETLRDIPVIVLSALDETDSAVRCIEMGAEDYLTKPFNPVLLRARANACLEKKRLRDQELTYLQQIQEAERRSDEVLNLILPLGIALSAETNFNRLAERILVEAKSICRADGGTLYLRTDDDCMKFAIMYNNSLNVALGGTTGKEIPLPPLPLYDKETGGPNHRNVVAYAALEGRSINIPDCYNFPGFDFSGTREFDRRHNYRTTSILSVPLKNHLNEVIGEIQLINAQDPKTHEIIPFNPYLQEVVECLSSQAAVALSNELLRHRQTELIKFEDELRIGRRIQADFLPSDRLNQVLVQDLWQPPGWEIAAYFSPARQVAGDFYDVFPLSGNHVGLVIADVCDKGVSAALFMALIRSLIRAFSERTLTPQLPIIASSQSSASNSIGRRLSTLLADLNALNTVFLTNNYIASIHSRSNMFATLFYGVLDPETGLLTYVNGGHEAPIILGGAGIKGHLAPTGPAVGMLPDMDFEIGQVGLEPGDILFSYTDGVTDARDPSGQLFTEARLLPLLEQPWPSAAALLSQVEQSLRSHIATASQFDDITLLAVRRLPSGAKSEEPG